MVCITTLVLRACSTLGLNHMQGTVCLRGTWICTRVQATRRWGNMDRAAGARGGVNEIKRDDDLLRVVIVVFYPIPTD
jgi:hypothetical protein